MPIVKWVTFLIVRVVLVAAIKVMFFCWFLGKYQNWPKYHLGQFYYYKKMDLHA